MAAHRLSCTALIALLTLFIAPHLSKSDVPLPHFSFGWKDDKNEFTTGDTASIKVKVLGNYKSEDYKYPFKPDFAVNNTMGNSSYFTDVSYDFGPDTNNWQIHFTPLLGGLFNVLITDKNFKVSDASMHFHVTPVAGPELGQFPRFAFGWLSDKDTFRAGDTATIVVLVLGEFKSKEYKYPFNPQITVKDKMGNSSYITGVSSDYGPDMGKWRIFFVPMMVGMFHVLLTDEYFKVFDASMHYYVTPGEIYTPGGIVSWLDQENRFVAGTRLTVLILPKDAFGNTVTSKSEGPKVYNFMAYATNEKGLNVSPVDVSNRGWNGFGYLYIDFTLVTSGSLSVHIKDKNTSLIGSPLSITIYPGELDARNCEASWNTETKSFQLFSTMETFVTQRDRYGNLVRRLHAFDFEVIEKGTNLPLPIGDLQYKEAYPGILLFSFRLVVPGDYLLIISDEYQNRIKNMPYEFTIYIGYCDGLNSIINGSGITNGSGLNFSAVGESTKFSIFLRDAYQYPSPVAEDRLQVKITVPPLTIHVNWDIFPIRSVSEMLDFGAFGSTGIDSVPSIDTNSSFWSWKTLSSAFEVTYLPEKSGVYEFHIFCGNIPLNRGYPLRKYIRPGEVNSTVSRVVKHKSRVVSLVVNYIEVEVMDSFSNHVLSQESKLELEIYGTNNRFFIFKFKFENGVYMGSYLIMEEGFYEMCVSFEKRHLTPCPFGVNVYRDDYFPKAYNDSVSVWEEESIAFSAVGNDYFEGENVRIVAYNMPSRGSLLQYGNMFRYTPYKGFYGNDTFTYSISDVEGNIASASVNIFVLCIPPQFVSSPSQLQANEESLSPKFGGFPGFELAYSDSLENISITLGAQHGTVFLSPLLTHLWDPIWNELSVNKVEGHAEDLCLVGRLEVINFALQSIQYIGDKNFSGSDAIRISTINRNGKNDLNVPIFVNPINDPPFIHVPKFIMLENVTEDEGFLIFNKSRDNFDFSIGDPDQLHFPGNQTHFRVLFSAEVSSGFFSAKLPAELISTTELKLKNSKQWQPLQTFVEISRHFTVKAKGIRFRGTINDCNTLLQEMLYYGDEHGGVLRLSVNDLGWYGSCPDCEEMMSAPLTTEATINLISKTPMNSLVAHSLGSVIVIEAILLSSLAVILMFFTCKCVIVLLREKKKQQAQSQNFQEQSFHEHTSSTDSSENITSPNAQNEQPFTLSDPLHEESGLG